MQAARGLMVGFVRAAERALSPGLVYALVWPAAAVKTIWELRVRFGRGLAERLPPSVAVRLGPSAVWRQRLPLNASKLLLCWPDRLREPRWLARVTSTGAGQIERIRAAGRPVVLATLHFGPMTAVLPILRRDGIPAAAVALRGPERRSAFRNSLQLRADRVNGLTGVPVVLGTTDLEGAVRFLRAGNVLVLPVDGPRGRRRRSTIGDHTVSLSAGVCQMAAMCAAVIVPCVLTAEPGLRVTVHFGAPVPDALVSDYRRHQQACEHLHREFLPVIGAHPEQWYPTLLWQTRPAAATGSEST